MQCFQLFRTSCEELPNFDKFLINCFALKIISSEILLDLLSKVTAVSLKFWEWLFNLKKNIAIKWIWSEKSNPEWPVEQSIYNYWIKTNAVLPTNPKILWGMIQSAPISKRKCRLSVYDAYQRILRSYKKSSRITPRPTVKSDSCQCDIWEWLFTILKNI